MGLLASPSYELRAFAIPTGVAFEDPRDVGHVLARQVHSGTSASAKRGEVRGLPSYGVDTADIMCRLADITDQVLRASKPGDIPYQQQSKFELIQFLTKLSKVSPLDRDSQLKTYQAELY